MRKNCGTRKVDGGIGIIGGDVQRSKDGKKKEEGEIMSGRKYKRWHKERYRDT